MSSYDEFIEAKASGHVKDGIKLGWRPDSLFPFQVSLTEWALARGRAGILADCGLGKTACQLTWAENVVRHTNKPVLILTPLAVGQQTCREGEKFGIDARRSRDGSLPHKGIVVTNYEKLHLFNKNDFAGVVADECFAPDTPIDIVLKDGTIKKHNIGEIEHGQTIINVAGRDRVIATHRRPIERAIAVTVDGHRIVSSDNHPYFTERGWVAASNLTKGDWIMESRAALRLVLGERSSEISGGVEQKVLREILLGEMEDEAELDYSSRPLAGDCCEARAIAVGVAPFRESQGGSRTGARSESKSDVQAGSTSQGVSRTQGHETSTIGSRRERMRHDETAGVALGDSSRMESRTRYIAREKETRISELLQGRPSRSKEYEMHRGGRAFPSLSQGSGCKERRHSGFVRVDCTEVLERGHSELERWRDADGLVYFCDLEAARHPSFSVNGLLVHNSSILKSFKGATQQAVTQFMHGMRFRLLCTATAAPNDHVELGTSSEALGELGMVDMLGRFFRQDPKVHKLNERERRKKLAAKGIRENHKIIVASTGGSWRLKHHAVIPFWRWVASWARACRKPSDLGFDNDGFDLPELIEKTHLVTSEVARDGDLFPMIAFGLQEEREERRRTINPRCEKVAELVNHKEQAMVWCHLNDEGNLLAKLIPDSVQVKGGDSDDFKEDAYLRFQSGDIRVLITKPKIGAWGLNLQNCAHVVTFASHSYEQYYQSVRRCWRFGQERPVTVDVVSSKGEAYVIGNMRRKAQAAEEMFKLLVANMGASLTEDCVIRGDVRMEMPTWV